MNLAVYGKVSHVNDSCSDNISTSCEVLYYEVTIIIVCMETGSMKHQWLQPDYCLTLFYRAAWRWEFCLSVCLSNAWIMTKRKINVSRFLANRPSVCLSVVCNVRAPYSDDWNFWQCFYAIWYLGHPDLSIKILRRSSLGNPSVGALNTRG